MLKVLVVEDEEMIRKGIVLAVDWAALDCVVVGEAANGEEALEAVERYHPTLIITDLKMPKLDGIQMLEKLRERGNQAYVIILTAYDSFSYAQSALRLGAVDFLLKPFHDGELEEAVTHLRRRLAAAPRENTQTQVSPVAGLKKGDKSKYVMEAMSYIGEHLFFRHLQKGGGHVAVGVPGHLPVSAERRRLHDPSRCQRHRRHPAPERSQIHRSGAL